MTVIESFNEVAEPWSRFMFDGLVGAAILVILLGGLWLVLRHRLSPQFTYCLFLLVLLRVTVPLHVTLPEWCSFMPLSNSLPEFISDAAVVEGEEIVRPDLHYPAAGMLSSTDTFPEVELMPAAIPIPSATTMKIPEPSLSIAAQLMLGWGIVVAGLLFWTMLLQWRLHRILTRGTRVDPEDMNLDLEELRIRVGVRQDVVVLTSDEIASPAVAGLWRPRILLPSSFSNNLTAQQLRWIILHELAHIRRRDLWLAVFQKTVQITHFFNPAVWVTNWIIDQHREYVCDDVALVAGDASRRECAGAFLSIIERVSQRPVEVPMTMSFLRFPNQIRRRLMRILDSKRPLRPRLSLSSILLLTVIGSFVVPQVRPNAWAQTEDETTSGEVSLPGEKSILDQVPTKNLKKADKEQREQQTLEHRLQSLESELRDLRRLLQDLVGQKTAPSSKPVAKQFAAVKRMDLSMPNYHDEFDVFNLMKMPTRITDLMADGAHAQRGDVIGRLSSESVQEQLGIAKIQREKARAQLLQAEAHHEIAKVQNETSRAQDRLQLDLAKLDLQSYLEGTYPLELKKLEATLAEAKEALAQARKSAEGESSQHSGVKKAENAVSIAEIDLEKLMKFERALHVARLEGALTQATSNMKRTEGVGAAQISEAVSAKVAAEQELVQAERRRDLLEQQVKHATLYALVDGVIHYADPGIKTGALVRERQRILRITPFAADQTLVLKDVLVVPVGAVATRGGKSVCVVQTEDGTAQRLVEVGRSTSEFIEITRGLKEGEMVLVRQVGRTESVFGTRR